MTLSKADADDSAGPLDEAWWVRDKAENLPPGDVPLLGPYEKTQPGFEIVFSEADFLQGPGDGYSRLGLWDIWENEKNPAETDPQKQKINEMQGGLGHLDDQARFIRIQIACLQRCHYTFPQNVDWIIEGIGRAEPVYKAVSCEPPWNDVLSSLARRPGHPAATSGRHSGDPHWRDRQELTRDYIRILTWWQFGGDLEALKLNLPRRAGLAETIYRRLGRQDKLKRLYAEKLRAALGWQAFPKPDFNRDASKELLATCDAAIREELGGKEDPIGRQIRPLDLCHHAFFRRVDHQIANIGAGEQVALPGAGQEGERIRDAVTNHVHALGSWLAGRTLRETIEIWPACEEVATRAYDMLGEATPAKRWLAACLWKTLLDNQSDHGRGALDEQPERFVLPAEALTA